MGVRPIKRNENPMGKFVRWEAIQRTYLGECIGYEWSDERQIMVVKARHFNGEMWDWFPPKGCVDIIE